VSVPPPFQAEIISNFRKAPSSQPGAVNICREKPFNLRFWTDCTAALHVSADVPKWFALDQVVCSTCPARGSGVVTAFGVDPSTFTLLERSESGFVVEVASSKTKYGLPYNTRGAMAEAKRQHAKYEGDGTLTVQLRATLRHGDSSIVVAIPGSLQIATGRHRRHVASSASTDCGVPSSSFANPIVSPAVAAKPMLASDIPTRKRPRVEDVSDQIRKLQEALARAEARAETEARARAEVKEALARAEAKVEAEKRARIEAEVARQKAERQAAYLRSITPASANNSLPWLQSNTVWLGTA
jgi:hypothetical protein